MRSPVSGLTTRGRCLIAAGVACAACAVMLDERDLLRIGALLIALPILSALVCRSSLLRLQITRTVRPQPLSVGHGAEVELQLRAGSRSSVAGLLLSDTMPASCGTTTRYTLGGLKSGAAASVRYPLTPRLRGRHQLGPLQICLADPLGLVELVRTVGEPTSVLVRPKIVSLAGGFGAAAAGAEHGAPPHALAPTVCDAQLRAYTPGDDTRSIHWASTARRDELMVRTAEHGQGAGTVVLLDNRRSAHGGTGEQASLERAISLTASIAEHLRRMGTPVRVLTTDGVPLAAAPALLDQLALLALTDQLDLGGVLRLAGGDGLIAVFGRVDERTAAALLDGRGGGRTACAVHLLPSPGVAALNAAGWNVVQAAGATPQAQLWSVLGEQGAGIR